MTPEPGAAAGTSRAAIAAWALVVGVTIVRGAFLAAVVPPFHAPDEPAHFDYAQRIAEAGKLPVKRVNCQWLSAEARVLADASLREVAFHAELAMPQLRDIPLPAPTAAARATSGCSPAAPYPPLYYASAAAAYRVASDRPFLERLYAARIASVAWGALGATAAFLLGMRLWGGAAGGVLLGLTYALQPMIAMLSSTVNNDAALFACSAVAFAAIAYLRGSTRPIVPLVALAGSTVAGVLSKPTFALVLPALFAFAILALGPRRRGTWIALIATFAPAACAYVAWSVYSAPIVADLLRGGGRDMPMSSFLRDWIFRVDRLERLWVELYWMTWGWVDTPVARAYYRAIELLLALSLAGLSLGWRSLAQDERWIVGVGAIATLAFVAVLYGIELSILRETPQPAFVQGRYLLPLFPLNTVMLFIGLRALAARFRVGLDPAWTVPAVLALVNVAGVLAALARYYA